MSGMNFLVCVDGSDNSVRAAKAAASMAKRTGSRIVLLHVVPTRDAECISIDDMIDESCEDLRNRIGNAIDVVKAEGADMEVSVQVGAPAEVILDMSGNYNAVFMGHQGHGFLEEAILGSVTKSVLNGIKVPLTLVP